MSTFNLDTFKVIGFDLDDTLHFYKNASQAATQKVLETIADDLNVVLENLQIQYSNILATMQSSHFTEDKPSAAYRSGRFRKLLHHYHHFEEQYITKLLALYDDSLAKYLSLKSGAMEVLVELKAQGKTVVIITEGPFDAQQLTIKRLGIAPFIDHLFASSKYGTSKTDSLFKLVLKALNCAPHELLYFGDNIERDYYAAKKLGIPAWLIQEDCGEKSDIKVFKNLQELLIDLLLKYLTNNQLFKYIYIFISI